MSAPLPAEDDLNARYDPMSRDELIAECEQQRAALEELGRHIFGGGWLDHASGCNGEVCNCGLRDWLRRHEKQLGISFGGDVPAVQEARPIARCDACNRVADNKMAGQRCFMEHPDGALCGGMLLTVL